jgi:hypothetical protein
MWAGEELVGEGPDIRPHEAGHFIDPAIRAHGIIYAGEFVRAEHSLPVEHGRRSDDRRVFACGAKSNEVSGDGRRPDIDCDAEVSRLVKFA